MTDIMYAGILFAVCLAIAIMVILDVIDKRGRCPKCDSAVTEKFTEPETGNCIFECQVCKYQEVLAYGETA